MEYVAFLRGINVGGSKSVKMADLRTAFEAMGFQSVRTVLASGNVIFEAERPASLGEPAAAAFENGLHGTVAVAQRVEEGLQHTFGRPMSAAVRTMADVRRLVESDPFARVPANPDTRLYITFLSQPEKGRPDFAYESPEGGLTIRRISAGEVAGTVILSPGRGTTELMQLLEKEFGAAVTTRNWDTLRKVVGQH
jgi:uncharacterized protein (DUF1697 family)